MELLRLNLLNHWFCWCDSLTKQTQWHPKSKGWHSSWSLSSVTLIHQMLTRPERAGSSLHIGANPLRMSPGKSQCWKSTIINKWDTYTHITIQSLCISVYMFNIQIKHIQMLFYSINYRLCKRMQSVTISWIKNHPRLVESIKGTLSDSWFVLWDITFEKGDHFRKVPVYYFNSFEYSRTWGFQQNRAIFWAL